MTEHRTVIQLARAGDLVSIFPVLWWWAQQQGRPIGVVTRPEFAPLFASVRYAWAIHCEAPRNGVGQAIQFCRDHGLPAPLAIQVDGNPAPLPAPCRNFIVEQWTRAGLADMFHRLPLVFDKRDWQKDMGLARNLLPLASGKPILAYCLDGISSKWEQAPAFERWLCERFSASYAMLNLGPLNLASMIDLHPLLAGCHRLVTIDTGPLHLSYASLVPTVALSIANPWYRSEPRAHWIEHLTYPEAMTPVGQERIAAAIENQPSRFAPFAACGIHAGNRRVIHVVNPYDTADIKSQERMTRARRSWEDLVRNDPACELWTYPTPERNSRTVLNDPRALPYVQDVFDFAAERANPADIILFTNADVALCREAGDALRFALSNAPCCYSHPADVTAQVPGPAHRHRIAGVLQSSGIGLFAFTPAWWRAVRDGNPPLFLGAEGWDAVLRWTMLRDNPLASVQPVICWHERHWAYWQAHLLDEPAQRHNRELCRRWAHANGKAQYLDPKNAPMPYLFGVSPSPATSTSA